MGSKTLIGTHRRIDFPVAPVKAEGALILVDGHGLLKTTELVGMGCYWRVHETTRLQWTEAIQVDRCSRLYTFAFFKPAEGLQAVLS
jgi:hypothetical protein